MVSDAERAGIDALLGPETRTAEMIDPSPLPRSVAALDGVGYAWPDTTARVSVYVFHDQLQASTALRHLDTASRAPHQGAVNGDLLMWATAPAEDGPALARIEDLAVRFARAR